MINDFIYGMCEEFGVMGVSIGLAVVAIGLGIGSYLILF